MLNGIINLNVGRLPGGPDLIIWALKSGELSAAGAKGEIKYNILFFCWRNQDLCSTECPSFWSSLAASLCCNLAFLSISCVFISWKLHVKAWWVQYKLFWFEYIIGGEFSCSMTLEVKEFSWPNPGEAGILCWFGGWQIFPVNSCVLLYDQKIIYMMFWGHQMTVLFTVNHLLKGYNSSW